MYSTDNGAETFTWPDGGTTMFRGEKNTNWEGGYRVPTVIRWPGVIKPGTVINDICAHEDMLLTLVNAAGGKDVAETLKKGTTIGGRSYKVHLDGYDLGPALRGEAKEWPRKEFIYWTDDGSVAALRYNNLKITFLEQKAKGLRVWQEPFTVLRAPLLTNLRMIRSSGQKKRTRWATSAGTWSACTRSHRRAPTSATGCRASRSFRHARNPAASTWSG